MPQVASAVAESCGTSRLLRAVAAGGRVWRGIAAGGKAGSGAGPEVCARLFRLGWILSHDLLGRQYAPGMDWPGAADCYRKSLAIEPADHGVRAAYATLLEFAPDGRRYVPEAKIEEALQQYRQIRKDRGQVAQADEVDNAFVVLLLRANQFAELEKVTASMEAPGRPLLLAAIAAQRGAAEAERMARSMGQGSGEIRVLLRTACSFWTRRAFIRKPRIFIRRPVRPATTLCRSKRRSGHLAGSGDSRRSSCAGRSPPAAQQLCIGLLMGGERKEQALGLFAKQASEAERLDSLLIADRSLQPWRRTDSQNLRAPQSNADVVSLFDFTTEGDKDSGYRVSVKGQFVTPFRCHVVLEAGGYRLLPLGTEACLGAAALDRLAAGDVAGAKRWLDWAWAEQEPRLGWFNSFAGSPFAQLWKELDHNRAEHIRVAAAALLSWETHAQQALPLLLEAQQHKPPPSQALQIDRAMHAYFVVEKPEER